MPIGSISGGLESMKSYIEISRQNRADTIYLKMAKNGRVVVGSRGRWGQFFVTVLNKLGLARKGANVLEHFRSALDSTYGYDVTNKALERGGMIGGKAVPLTATKVRQVLDFAVAVKREVAVAKVDEYAGQILDGDRKIKLISGVEPKTLGQSAINYFRYHFTQALTALGSAASSDPLELDRLAGSFIVRAKQMEGEGLAGKSVSLATKADESLDTMLDGIKRFDATAVLSSGTRLQDATHELALTEHTPSRPAADTAGKAPDIVGAYANSMPKMKNITARALRRADPKDLELLQKNIDMLLRAAEIADEPRKADGEEVIGLSGTRDTLMELQKNLDLLRSPGAARPSHSSALDTFSGLANFSGTIGAVTAFGGKPQDMPQYQEFHKRVGGEVAKFMKASRGATRIPSSMPPIFRKLFAPTSARDVHAGLNILKKYFDATVDNSAAGLSAAVDIWRDVGEEERDLLASVSKTEDPEIRSDDRRRVLEMIGIGAESGDKKWRDALQPIERSRRQFVALAQLMESHQGGNSLVKDGGGLLKEMLEFYPWQGADKEGGAPFVTTLGILAMPREFRMVRNEAAPLQASWRVGSSALSDKYLEYRTESLRKLATQLSGELHEVDVGGGRKLEIPAQFRADVARETVMIVVNGKEESVLPPGETDTDTMIAAATAKLADYIGDEKDLQQISSLMTQASVADNLRVYDKGFMLQPIVPSSGKRMTGIMPYRAGGPKVGATVEREDGTRFSLNKVNSDTYKITWRSPVHLTKLSIDTGYNARHGDLAMDMRRADGPSVISEEEILLSREGDGWKISLPVEQIEVRAPPSGDSYS